MMSELKGDGDRHRLRAAAGRDLLRLPPPDDRRPRHGRHQGLKPHGNRETRRAGHLRTASAVSMRSCRCKPVVLSARNMTVSVTQGQLFTDADAPWNAMMAAAIIYVLPDCAVVCPPPLRRDGPHDG
jgi:hypothetical protein